MAVLVTGGTGLVGSHLLPRLLEAGLECRGLVRGARTLPAGVTAVEGDLFDREALSRATEGVSDVVHLAAVFRSQDADLIWRSNFEGTLNLISAVKGHARNARFILASTSNVYDAHNPHPGREDDLVDPRHAYPASKVAAEKALRNSGLNWVVLRFPFVYGNGDGHLEELPKHARAGRWHPARRISTLHHRDVATAIALALDGVFDGRIVNVSDEAPSCLLELATLVGEPLEPSAEPLQDPWHLHVDGSLARRLGFRPRVRTVWQAVQEGLM